MSGPLAGKVVMVTGAATGIGRALADGFSSDGARVAGAELAARVGEAGQVCELALACDVTDPAQLTSSVEAVESSLGPIDVVVANAGIARQGPVLEASWADISDVLDVNFYGVLHTLRAVLPGMVERGRGRAVVLVSRNAELCPAGLVGYSTSKAAAVTLTRTLARELAGHDVLVNNLIPGPSRTEMNPAGTQDPSEAYPTARMLATLPAGGPSGRTFWKGEEYPFWSRFSREA